MLKVTNPANIKVMIQIITTALAKSVLLKPLPLYLLGGKYSFRIALSFITIE